MLKTKLFFLCLFLVGISYGQNDTRIFEKASLQNDVLEVYLNDGVYRIHFYSDKIVENSFIPKGEEYSNKSHAVILKKENLKTRLKESEGFLSFKSEDFEVRIDKAPFQIHYLYQNKSILSENKGYVKNDSLEVLNFVLDASEALYGGGARALGMNRRGNRLELYNKADYGYETHSKLMNFTMPIVLSSKRYMIHFDNPQIGWLDLDSKNDNSLNYETIGGRKTYQVVVGDTWEALLNSYTNLTGKQPLPPRWALGNFASRFGYHSEEEARNVVAKFKFGALPASK